MFGINTNENTKIDFVESLTEQEAKERLNRALLLIADRSGGDCPWLIDNITKIIAGDKYEAFVSTVKSGPLGPDTYDWNTGKARSFWSRLWGA